MVHKVVTVSRHIMEQERRYPAATGEFSDLLTEIILAAKIIQREVNKAGLVNILGKAGETNVQGEEQMKLDVFADLTIFNALDHTGHLCVMASEENEAILHIPDRHPRGKYVLNFDPLDGSSNIDANVSIGTIFSILHRVTPGDGHGDERDCMQPGVRQVCAGYVMYGSSTMFVYTTGQGVHGFTSDLGGGVPAVPREHPHSPEGDDLLHQRGELALWASDHTASTTSNGGPRRRGSGILLLALHRYPRLRLPPNAPLRRHLPDPADRKVPREAAVLYQAAPIASSWSRPAAGRWTAGRIMDVEPVELHQRIPLVIGECRGRPGVSELPERGRVREGIGSPEMRSTSPRPARWRVTAIVNLRRAPREEPWILETFHQRDGGRVPTAARRTWWS